MSLVQTLFCAYVRYTRRWNAGKF
uniref:Uncharacterized protein n=1 Tax=Anguilla anguilla TaxID=7936 RepID=A0A0E9P7X0_ANGAN